MNIFFLSYSPQECAKWMVDKHVVKMIVETAQLLSTAHHVLDGKKEGLYKPTHINHPCAVWARESAVNYKWLFDLFDCLLEEYTYRFHKIHASSRLKPLLEEVPTNIPPFNGMTEPPIVMPDMFALAFDDPIDAYRNYYSWGKAHLFKWTKREPPRWILLGGLIEKHSKAS